MIIVLFFSVIFLESLILILGGIFMFRFVGMLMLFLFFMVMERLKGVFIGMFLGFVGEILYLMVEGLMVMFVVLDVKVKIVY